MTYSKTILIAASLLVSGAISAQAECYADYKAKKPSPLQLHYGVVQLPDALCNNKSAAKQNIAQRIGVGGWNLLTVMSVFGPEGLQQRRNSAGEYFLKY